MEPSDTCCDYYGVVCDNDGNMVELELGYNNLQGTIPTEVGLFTALTSGGDDGSTGGLFSGNGLTGSIPSEIGLWTNMRKWM